MQVCAGVYMHTQTHTHTHTQACTKVYTDTQSGTDAYRLASRHSVGINNETSQPGGSNQSALNSQTALSKP